MYEIEYFIAKNTRASMVFKGYLLSFFSLFNKFKSVQWIKPRNKNISLFCNFNLRHKFAQWHTNLLL
jgi:hypothetical protein